MGRQNGQLPTQGFDTYYSITADSRQGFYIPIHYDINRPLYGLNMYMQVLTRVI